MDLLLGTSDGGDPAVDTPSAPVRIEPRNVHLEAHTPLRPEPDFPYIPTAHLTDHHLWNVSDRDITEAARTESAASQALPTRSTDSPDSFFPNGATPHESESMKPIPRQDLDLSQSIHRPRTAASPASRTKPFQTHTHLQPVARDRGRGVLC